MKKELIYFVHTRKANRITRPHLFRLNGISHEKKLMNFAYLLEDESSYLTVADLPTNDDLVNALNVSTSRGHSS